MANVTLKTDFRDGEKLFGYQLNNNFKAIQAALDAMNKIVWQDEQENPDSVLVFRGTTEELMNRMIINGQLLYDVNTGETYIDYEGRRISTGSGNAIHIGEDEPTNASTQLWIPNDDFASVGTEVVDSLEGNETTKAPSVNAINKMKNGLEEAINGYVLYNDTTGSNGNITLSDSVANYKYVEIEFRYWETYFPLFKFYEPSSKSFAFSTQSGDQNFIRGKISLSNTTLTRDFTKLTSVNTGAVSTTDEVNMYITRVVGYK